MIFFRLWFHDKMKKSIFIFKVDMQVCFFLISKQYNLQTLVKRICCSVAELCPVLCNPVDCRTPSFPCFTICQSVLRIMAIELEMLSNHLILCRPLLLLPSIFPSIRVFSNKSALCIRWPKYWSFSFSISPFSEQSGLIFFRID